MHACLLNNVPRIVRHQVLSNGMGACMMCLPASIVQGHSALCTKLCASVWARACARVQSPLLSEGFVLRRICYGWGCLARYIATPADLCSWCLLTTFF